ncbi:uncharacterized protein LOC115890460 [Sitophilus oryzae]|uniref:Uncharacterized protein LOC115890460 n=1 Tax=Sitophilus oryzae TaxID=7048 RepID=A0A6J2YUP4_SITOR|nr:uncharacterized protein LOC115890460 [Sitophilus oryzae]
MSSKKFKNTVKTITRNLVTHTDAMEVDLQILIANMLEIIESKITSLKKLLKLKMYIRRVKGFSSLQKIVNVDDVTSETYSISKQSNLPGSNAVHGSLDDLPSLAYALDQSSLPASEAKALENIDEKSEDVNKGILDMDSLCCDLNPQKSQTIGSSKKLCNSDKIVSLDKYIYVLLDEEFKKYAKEKEDRENRNNNGDREVSESKQKPASVSKSSVVLLSRSDYESIIDILNSVLAAYKQQEKREKLELLKKNLGKSITEPTMNNKSDLRVKRKTCSDSLCDKKEIEKKENKKWTSSCDL